MKNKFESTNTNTHEHYSMLHPNQDPLYVERREKVAKIAKRIAIVALASAAAIDGGHALYDYVTSTPYEKLGADSSEEYTVRQGDTIFDIATHLQQTEKSLSDNSIDEIATAITDVNYDEDGVLQPGQTLKLPADNDSEK